MLQASSSRETRNSAKEVKFVVPADRAGHVLEWARARLAPDPHGGGPSGDQYHTATIYFDTEERAVYGRQGSYGRSKYRIRRYGASDVAFLERKMRTSALLSKRRTAVPVVHVQSQLEAQAAADPSIHWFRDRVLVRQLKPVCQVVYRRHALVAAGTYGPMRLTFDYDLTAQPNRSYTFVQHDGVPVATGFVILEMKYCLDSPALFRHLVADFQLSASAVSKYRLAVDALDALARPEASPARARAAGAGEEAAGQAGYASA
jgi:hypothetical protein